MPKLFCHCEPAGRSNLLQREIATGLRPSRLLHTLLLPRSRPLSIPILHSISSAGKPPVDVVVRAACEARRALHAVLVGCRRLLPVPAVHVRGAKRGAGPAPLVSTFCQADVVVTNGDVALFVVLVGEQEKLLFELHRITFHARYASPINRHSGRRLVMAFQIMRCLSRLGIPSTVSISCTARLTSPG